MDRGPRQDPPTAAARRTDAERPAGHARASSATALAGSGAEPDAAPARRRPATGAAVFQPKVTAAISEAVLGELTDKGYGGLSMEAVARRAGVGKSALYRRWPARSDMVVSVLAELSIPSAEVADQGSLTADLVAALRAMDGWLTDPSLAAVLPDLTAHAAREPRLADALRRLLGEPRRALGAAVLGRAVERGELGEDVDLELALDLLGGPLYWRHHVRRVAPDADYHHRLAVHLVRALAAEPQGSRDR